MNKAKRKGQLFKCSAGRLYSDLSSKQIFRKQQRKIENLIDSMFPPSNQAHKQRITISNNFDPQNAVDSSSKQRSPKQVQFVDPQAVPKESRLQWKTNTPTENNQPQTQMNNQQQFQRDMPLKQIEFQAHGVILEENEEDSSQQNTSHNENYIEDHQNQEIQDSCQTEPVQSKYFQHNNFEQPERNQILTNQLELPNNNEDQSGIQQQLPLSAIKQSIRSRLEELETRIVEEGQSDSNLRKQINQMEDAITETASELDDFSHYSRSAKATSTKQTPRMLGEKDEYNFVSGSKSQKFISQQSSVGNSADKNISEIRENNTERLNGIIPNSFSFRLREKQEEDQFKKYYEETNKKINEFKKDEGTQREEQQIFKTNLLMSPKSPENRDLGRFQKLQTNNNNNNKDKQLNVRPSTMRSNVSNRNQVNSQQSQSFTRDKGFVNSFDLKNYLEEDLNRSKTQQNELSNIRNSIKQGLKLLKDSIPLKDQNDVLIIKSNQETNQYVDNQSTFKEQIQRQEAGKSKQQEQDETQEQIKQLQQKLQKYEQDILPIQVQTERDHSFQTKQNNNFESKITSNGEQYVSENEKYQTNGSEFIGKTYLHQDKKGVPCGRLQVKSIKDYSAAEEAEQELRKIEKEGEEYQKQLQQRKKEIEGKEAEARLQRTIADCIRVYTEQRNDKLAQTRQDKQEVTCNQTRIQSYLVNPPRQQQTSKIREIISRKVHSWLNQSVDNLAPKNSRIQIKQHQGKSMKAS